MTPTTITSRAPTRIPVQPDPRRKLKIRELQRAAREAEAHGEWTKATALWAQAEALRG